MNTRFCGTHPSCLQARVVYLFSDLSFHSSADPLVHRLVREPRLDTDTDGAAARIDRLRRGFPPSSASQPSSCDRLAVAG